ncbi:universal stress protein [Caulobacter sp. KR2-114]|uniref:universal stress protein n=1 Tax=Caulobacter sp. KR2-114 TaxID=3400912 RepID=UPI003BFCB936
MSYASIMLHVSSEAAAQPRLACAHDLAARFDATLIGVGAEMTPPIADSGYGFADNWYVLMADEIDRRLKAAESQFREAAKDLARPAVWECGLRYPTGAVVLASRAADLIVASRPQGGDIHRHADPAELAIASGRPVFIPPSTPRPLDLRRVLLAWKDTREARRAMSDALPLLQRAEAVRVLELCHGDEADDARIRTNDVAAALRRHGVAAEADVSVRTAASGHDVMAEADAFDAGLIVAGAYGHSRLGEWVFGGMTRDLLAHGDRCVLLSH